MSWLGMNGQFYLHNCCDTNKWMKWNLKSVWLESLTRKWLSLGARKALNVVETIREVPTCFIELSARILNLVIFSISFYLYTIIKLYFFENLHILHVTRYNRFRNICANVWKLICWGMMRWKILAERPRWTMPLPCHRPCWGTPRTRRRWRGWRRTNKPQRQRSPMSNRARSKSLSLESRELGRLVSHSASVPENSLSILNPQLDWIFGKRWTSIFMSTYKFPLLRLSSWMEKDLSYNYGTQQARRGSRGQSPTTTTGMSAPLSLCMTLLAWQASLL